MSASIFRLESISRRNFIKLGSMGFVAMFGFTRLPEWLVSALPDINHIYFSKNVTLTDKTYQSQALSPNQQGRVLEGSIDLYDRPSFTGKRVKTCWLDSVLPITGITIGKYEDSFNLVWYELNNEGFAHSGSIQPVFTITNPVVANLPQAGAIAEVTVPFTDAHWDPGEDEPVAYRFYYATTYWVMETVSDADGNAWYGIRDDKWEYMFYVRAHHLRIIPPGEIKTISANVPSNMKRIEVHLPEQVMIAFEYGRPVFMARIASGAKFSNGDFSTPAGKYMTFHKRPSRHMARGNLAANGYDLPGVPWNSYITEEGIAFHGTYWHNNFGRPRSHGCINLTPQAAKWVYLWTLPNVPPVEESVYEETGTAVEILE